MTAFQFTMCFHLDGKTLNDAHEQAIRTQNPVLYFIGERRWMVLPIGLTLPYTTKDEVGAASSSLSHKPTF